MGINSVAFRTAKNLVSRYESEADEIMAHHHQAMECHACEDFLELGISGFDWIQRAIREFRARSIKGDDAFAEGERTLRELRGAWIKLATVALEWSRKQVQRGYAMDKLGQLELHLELMRRIASEEGKMAEIARKVPTDEELSLIAIEPPREWLDERSWTTD